jgi:Xaa-Pro aminopeptidase
MNHADRVARLMEGLERPILVTNLTNIRYLTGFTGTAAFFYATPTACTFLTDGRYGEVAAALVTGLPDTDLKVSTSGMLDPVAETLGGSGEVDMEADDASWALVRSLRDRTSTRLRPASGVVEQYRMIKDDEEIEALRRAAAAGDRAFGAVTELAQGEPTEGELGERLVASMREAGGDAAGWPPIVAMNANAARPHHRAGTDTVGAGVLLLDYGCVVEGYHSDMTRTVMRGSGVDPEFARVYAAVLESNVAGIAAAVGGAVAGDVDAVCRAVLDDYGYLEAFVHSTGHGVGLDIHEGPSVRRGSEQVLEPGNVVTIEPGVYLPGRFGVRIEDMVVVTDTGNEVLTRSDKELIPA